MVASAVVAGLIWWSGDEPLRAVAAPELRPAPEPFTVAGSAASTDGEAPRATGAKARKGNSERPEEVPRYEILEDRRDRRDGARSASLLVDTRSRDEEGYTLIARDLKARYRDLDAVSVQFIDLTGPLRYNGGALIFNTPAGIKYLGYVYGPPNGKGYYVQAAD